MLACAVAGVRRRSGHASGSVISAEAAKVHIAAAHPAALITACTSGANTNCPNEPPALMTPAAIERFCAGMCCAVAPIRIEKLPAPAPAADSTPNVNSSPHSEGSVGASAMPAAWRASFSLSKVKIASTASPMNFSTSPPRSSTASVMLSK